MIKRCDGSTVPAARHTDATIGNVMHESLERALEDETPSARRQPHPTPASTIG